MDRENKQGEKQGREGKGGRIKTEKDSITAIIIISLLFYINKQPNKIIFLTVGTDLATEETVNNFFICYFQFIITCCQPVQE
jgi:hypothetical protein